MVAFRGAVEVGAHGLETDLHLSADGVAVISHVGPLISPL
jgi:phosphatidylglycerol phospholipase C